MDTVANEGRLYRILLDMKANGWTTIGSMATLVGYKHVQSIFEVQRSSNPIPCIKVGRTQRVHKDDALEFMRSQLVRSDIKITDERKHHIQFCLDMYRRINNG